MKWKDIINNTSSLSQHELDKIQKDSLKLADTLLKGKVYTMYNEKYNITIKCTDKYLKMWEDRGFKVIGEEVK
jgi:hypothetical protein